MRKILFIWSLLLGLFSIHANATVVYVDSAHIGGTQNGTSWVTAFSDFQAGINAAHAGDSVWVAKGTYLPPANTSFNMKDSVMIFGGFLNTNTAFEQRNVQNNVTILKGNESRVITNISDVPTMMHFTCLSGFTVTNGHVTGYTIGGGILNNRASPSIIDCIFKDNSSIAGGGGLESYKSGSLVSNCTFYDNTGIGGAIHNAASSLIIINCKFLNNHGVPNSFSFYNSGAILSSSSTDKITNCYFDGNNGKYGGAIMIHASADTITKCIFTDNAAIENGGAISTQAGSRTFVSNCTFSNNEAKYGGAIYYFVDTFTTTNCNFSGNKAARGGALYSPVSNWISVNNCTFLKDTALIDGGAIYFRINHSSITNCLFAENTADSLGAAIYLAPYFVIQTPFPITNSTFVNNIGSGNAATLFAGPGGKVILSNSVIWNNTNGVAIADTSASFSITYSLVQGEPASILNHNLSGSTNPLFANLTGGNYRLQFNSPCADKGNNDSIPTGITTDIAGNNRIWNNTVDMGAYEYAFALDLGNDTTICSGSPITLDAQNQGSTYLWNNGSTTQTITVNTAGTYSVLVTNLFGSLSDTINITVNPSPIVTLGNDTFINQGTSLILDAGNPGDTYLWNVGDTTQTISVNANGGYIVTVTNNKGCSGTDTIIINVKSLGIGNTNAIANSITISPNPTKEIIHINITDGKLLHTNAILTDAYGRIIRSVMMENKSQQLSLAGLVKGIYIFKMENGAAVKIVKEQ